MIKRAILTGATGAIGTALVHELIKQHVEVLVLTRPNSQRNGNILSHQLVTVRYCALEELDRIQNETEKKYDVFFHFAWMGAAGSGRNDMYMQNANVKYTLDAVGAAQRFGCHTFIGAGSQAEYGRASCKLSSDTPAFPEMGYGYAKLCAGQMSRSYAHQLGLRHIWVRILSVYGPNDGAQTLVMHTITSLERGETPQLTLGEQLWDYLYSADAAKAFAAIAQNGVDGRTYVLGSGTAKPLKEYIEIIRRETAPDGKVDLGAVPYGEKQVMYLCADTSALSADTGWRPETDFAEGIRKILDIL